MTEPEPCAKCGAGLTEHNRPIACRHCECNCCERCTVDGVCDACLEDA